MIDRLALATFTLITTTAVVCAEPIFAPVPDGFRGTAFRGVALGQSRADVEAALASIGKRCVADEELIDDSGTAYYLYIEKYDDYSTCRIANSDAQNNKIYARDINLLSIELVFGLPLYAISFQNDRAAAISLLPEYFNAAGSVPYAFAQTIADSYGIPFLEPMESGWRGQSQSGELVQVWRGNAIAPLWMTVFLATDENTPTFN